MDIRLVLWSPYEPMFRKRRTARTLCRLPRLGKGLIHRLVLNAGVSQNRRVEESGAGLEEIQMGVNYFGSVWTARAALPYIVKAAEKLGKGPGSELERPRISIVGSLLGRLPAPKNAAYSASKHALHGYFERLVRYLCLFYVSRAHVFFSITASESSSRLFRSPFTISLPGPVSTGIISSLYGPSNSLVS